MQGIAAYSRPSPDGKGVTVDTEAMLVDLITVCKAGGVSQSDFFKWVAQTYDKVDVSVSVPGKAKN